jgi:6-phosphofructokinase 1
MKDTHLDLIIPRLGESPIPSPMDAVNFISDGDHILYHTTLPEIEAFLDQGKKPPHFEIAGPREHIYFDPSKLRCGIVTCGGLCLNCDPCVFPQCHFGKSS